MAVPLTHDELVKTWNDASPMLQSNEERNAISVRLLDVLLNNRFKPKLVYEDSRLSVVVETDAASLDISRAVNKLEVILLDTLRKQYNGAIYVPGL
jgi:hypothetical protein